MKTKRIFLVEDHSSFRQSLAMMFDMEDGFEVAGQAGSLAEARKVASKLAEDDIDLGVLDLNLPDGEGMDLIAEFRERNPEFAALILTASLDRAEHARAVEAGAGAVLHKAADLDEIVEYLKRLSEGETLIPPEELVEMIRLANQDREQERKVKENIERLTRREIQVLEALSDGLSNKGIAEYLHMSVDTERTHMVNILNKLGAHSRLQALVFAARYGLVEIKRR
ncbi:MAG: response regulator transcription factor [Actinomycetota bacterium]|nr:response regulator transcription factor [Actinomycetota bacterium]